MASAQQKMTLDFLFSSNNAEVVRRNGRNTNVIKIGGVSNRYRRDMPITQRLKTKLSKVRKTMDLQKYQLDHHEPSVSFWWLLVVLFLITCPTFKFRVLRLFLTSKIKNLD